MAERLGRSMNDLCYVASGQGGTSACVRRADSADPIERFLCVRAIRMRGKFYDLVTLLLLAG